MAKVRCPVLGCEGACHRAKVRQIPHLWTPAMDQTLVDALGRGMHPGEIAARMHLTVDSIKWRIKQLNHSLREGWRSRQEVAAVLGVGRRSVDRWMLSGDLRVTRHGRRWTRVRDADLEAFVVAQAGLLFDTASITDPSLRRLAETSAMANRRRAVSKPVNLASILKAAGVESQLELLLLNRLERAGLPVGEAQFRFVPGRQFRWDRCWPDVKVAVEVQGGTWTPGGAHSRGSGIARDCLKFSLGAALGWRVLPLTKQMIESGQAVELIAQALGAETP